MKKVWSSKLPILTILTLYPGISDTIISDLTSILITNNVDKNNFGGFFSVNLYSEISLGKWELTNLDSKENDDNLECVQNSKYLIIACGSLPKTNRVVGERLEQIKTMLKKEKLLKKIKILTDEKGEENFYPLASKIRNNWRII